MILSGLAWLLAACHTAFGSGSTILFRDDFHNGLGNWIVEAERPGRIAAERGVLDIDVPAGATLWFRHEIRGPVAIEYEVTAVAKGGPNDQVSDVNAFWMATDTRVPSGNVLERRRSGAFADYDELRTYYVGIGGNRNSTSRFRRYIGRRDQRPLLPQHALSAKQHLLEPNRPYRMRLVAADGRIEAYRDGVLMFRFDDSEPYVRGHFGLRTTKSHLKIWNFKVLALR
ncbi:MAG: DUF6250 domain-containing protein [Sphingomicrobium sp.]